MCFDCFSPSTSLCPLLAVGLSLVLSVEGAFSKALRMNCSNGNINSVCAVVLYAIHPTPRLVTIFAVKFSNHHVHKSPSLTTLHLPRLMIAVYPNCVYHCGRKADRTVGCGNRKENA